MGNIFRISAIPSTNPAARMVVCFELRFSLFTFALEAIDCGVVRVRPLSYPKHLMQACAGAECSLLTDGDGRFIWIANAEEPTTFEAACNLARRWAEGIMLDQYPIDWPRDQSLW